MLKNPTVLKYMIFILAGIILVLSIAVIYLVFKKNEYYVEEEGEVVKPTSSAKKPQLQPIELDVMDDEVTKVVPTVQTSSTKKGLLFLVLAANQSTQKALMEFPCVIGRDPSSELVLNDPAVSRKHCQILKEDGSFFLEDLAEHNGTFLNGEKMIPNVKVKLNLGDEIMLGHVTLKLEKDIRA
ncbi:FHA domain-containing protein [Bulleidia sp. zg-1006]|uniref:FHA domain-containing protein n=1 Tax=Bulleidia sp. zg-1006 TaxID=2806552 RepID=UPI00193A89DF|nr:FHA domain-containing protein [Bulleidia sp. zg-1006]QRG86720.1 FHA domain-containing protein [Bulleidia sp. zg-1006]